VSRHGIHMWCVLWATCDAYWSYKESFSTGLKVFFVGYFWIANTIWTLYRQNVIVGMCDWVWATGTCIDIHIWMSHATHLNESWHTIRLVVCVSFLFCMQTALWQVNGNRSSKCLHTGVVSDWCICAWQSRRCNTQQHAATRCYTLQQVST